MLRLQCMDTAEIEMHSRVAVLDTGSRKYDYGIVTGHGVPPNRPCRVRDFGGRISAVDMIVFAEGYAPSTQTDWALLRFDRLSTPHLVRYEVEAVMNSYEIDGMHIEFAEAIGLRENAQSCHLETLDFTDGSSRVSHNCKVVSGQSGTPVTRNFNGKDRLIGLHVGQLWMHRSPKTGKPDRKGYINLFDENTVEQIKVIIAENS